MRKLLRTQRRRKFARNLLIEFGIYGVLLVIYFFAVLRLLGGVLSNLFESNLIIYAFVGLGLIVAQGVLLESITSFFIRLLRLDRLD